jgi:hypothetical protein
MAKIKGGRPGTEQMFDPRGPWQDMLREVDHDGNVVWEWEALNLDIEKHSICPLCRRHEWAHANTCAPMPNGDIIVSFRYLNLLIIVDRQTGKIKWEYQDSELGHQHDCHLLEYGNVLVYRNGWHAHESMHSSILQFDPYTKEHIWEYFGSPKLSFLSPHISGAQRLANGNKLICEGGKGCIFEVTRDGETVWEYIADISNENPPMGLVNWVFRAYRYSADSPQIRNRVEL